MVGTIEEKSHAKHAAPKKLVSYGMKNEEVGFQQREGATQCPEK